MNKAYILTFDKGGVFDRFDYTRLHEQLTNDPRFISWFHYLENSYILITSNKIGAKDISDLYKRIGNGRFCFVSEIDINNCNGWLPPPAWEWIKKFQKAHNPWGGVF
jgi:hypothetical protein